MAAALAPPLPAAAKDSSVSTVGATTSKSGRIMPVVPIISPSMKTKAPVRGIPQSYAIATAVAPSAMVKQPAEARPVQASKASPEDANRDARAAVAAAMANLPPSSGQKKQTNGGTAMDNLTNKVNEMRTNDNIRTSRQPGTGGYAAGHRGGRGAPRGGRSRTDSQTKKMEVPKTDYDFAEANAKFNKQDLVKEAIASGDPITSPIDGTNGTPEVSLNGSQRDGEHITGPSAPAGYSKTSSFFDNISSESKDREDASTKKVGGREFRSEEQKKNLETFGQGSVDNYRGGFRGRGRVRGFRGARGSSRGGRGGGRGRGGTVAAEG